MRGTRAPPPLALDVPRYTLEVIEAELEADANVVGVTPTVTDTTEDSVMCDEAAGDPVPLPSIPPREAELAGDPVGDPPKEAVRVLVIRAEAVPIPTKEVEPESV